MPVKHIPSKPKPFEKPSVKDGEFLFRSFVQQNIDGALLIDPEGSVVEWNHSMEEITQYQAGDIIGMKAWDMQMLLNVQDDLSLEKSQRLKKIYLDVIHKGTIPESFETQETAIYRKNRTKTFVEQKLFIIQTSGGNYLAASFREVFERVRLAGELQAERDFALQIINTVGQGLSVTDVEGNFILVNPAYAKLIGYEPHELIGRSPREFSAAVDLGILEHAHQERMEGRVTSYFSRLIHRNGHEVKVLITGAPRIRDGQYIGAIASITDLTEIRNAEAEREKLIAELTAKNAELERFTYTVSHDLKSPLVTISGFLNYLEMAALSGDMERFAADKRRIQSAVVKMQSLMNELLELSRIGRILNDPSLVPFTDLAVEAANAVRGTLDERRVSLHIQPDLPMVYVDKPRLVEVLQNLLENSVKYMGNQAQPQIEIGQRGRDGDRIIFFVRDNGIGIAPEYHERVFGLFDKLDPNSEGTGIGLALVKRIIEFHGGRIWVESELEQGAAFLFTLPEETTPFDREND